MGEEREGIRDEKREKNKTVHVEKNIKHVTLFQK
jgi:hypothetical protein